MRRPLASTVPMVLKAFMQPMPASSAPTMKRPRSARKSASCSSSSCTARAGLSYHTDSAYRFQLSANKPHSNDDAKSVEFQLLHRKKRLHWE